MYLDRMTGLIMLGAGGGGGSAGGGSCKLYECASVDDGGSWSGYEWLLTTTEEGESVYALSETLTEGLSWSSVKPKIGKSYSEDVLAEVSLYTGSIIPTDYIYHWTMGHAGEFSDAYIQGSPTYSNEHERPFASFNGSSQINFYDLPSLPTNNNPFSMALWVRSETPFYDASSPASLLAWGKTPYNPIVAALSWNANGTSWFTNWLKDSIKSPALTDGEWHHLVATHDGATSKMYVDGALLGEQKITFAIGGTELGIGGNFWTTSNMFTGDLSEIYIFNRALENAEIMGLYKEYAGK